MKGAALLCSIIHCCTALLGPCRDVAPRTRRLARPPDRPEFLQRFESLRENFTLESLQRPRITLESLQRPRIAAPKIDAEGRREIRRKLVQTSRVVRVFAGKQFERNVFALFNATDANNDGELSETEAYPIVLQLYILANRQAPVNPPSRELAAKLFDDADLDGSGSLSRDEFVVFCTSLLGRTAYRIAVFNVVRFAVAPVLATAVARKLISENWILSLEPNLVQTLSVVIFVALLGNVALAALDTAERLRDNPPEIPVLFREEGSLPEFIAGLRRQLRRLARSDDEESGS